MHSEQGIRTPVAGGGSQRDGDPTIRLPGCARGGRDSGLAAITTGPQAGAFNLATTDTSEIVVFGWTGLVIEGIVREPRPVCVLVWR